MARAKVAVTRRKHITHYSKRLHFKNVVLLDIIKQGAITIVINNIGMGPWYLGNGLKIIALRAVDL